MQVKSQKVVFIDGEAFIVNALLHDMVVVRHADGGRTGFQSTKKARELAGLPPLETNERTERMGLWLICGECDGAGKHSNRLGVIDIREWEDEELDRYFAGDYDKPCGCNMGYVWTDAEHLDSDDDGGDDCECVSCQQEADDYAAQDAATRRAECGYSYE